MERKEVGSVNKAGMLERGKNKVEEDVGNALKKESGFVNQSDKVDRVTLNSHTTYAEEGKTHEENGELSCGSEENAETESNPPASPDSRESVNHNEEAREE
ncbi:hypothetical protein ACSQ67_000618 [Phaseolus vulgaris]